MKSIEMVINIKLTVWYLIKTLFFNLCGGYYVRNVFDDKSFYEYVDQIIFYTSKLILH